MTREVETNALHPFTCTLEFCMKADIVEGKIQKTVKEELEIIKSIHEKPINDQGVSQ